MAENEMSSTDENQESEAEAALKAADGTPSAEESEQLTVPLEKHTALRTRAQAAETQAANLQGQLTGLKAAQAHNAPAVKSPIEMEKERQAAEGVDPADMTVPLGVLESQRVFDQRVANLAADTKAKGDLAALQLQSFNKSKTLHDDLAMVTTTGESLLTPGERVDIERAGANFGELFYEKSLAAIERNKPEPEKKPEAAPEKKPSESEADNTKVPTQAEILADLNVDPATIAAAKL